MQVLPSKGLILIYQTLCSNLSSIERCTKTIYEMLAAIVCFCPMLSG